MKHANKLLILSIFSLIAVSAVSAQAPERPHNIYGTVTEADTGNALSGYTVQVVDSSDNVLKSAVTDSDGFYDLYVAADSGESLTVKLEGKDVSESVTYSSGKVSEVDFSYDTPDSGSSLSVSVSDESVDEGLSVELEPSVSNPGSNPSYSWSITGDDHGASLVDEGSEVVTFNAPDDVEFDRVVDVSLEVSNDGGGTDSDTAVVTVVDTDLEGPEDEGSEGGAPGANQTDEDDTLDNQTDGNQTDDSQDQQPGEEPLNEVDARSENGTASADVGDIDVNEKVRVNVPDESAVSGDSSIESVSFSSSSSANNVNVEVEDVGNDFEKVSESVDNKKPGGKVYGYQNIDVSNVEDNSFEGASVNFKVRKSFVEDNDASVSDVRLNRFNDGEWESFKPETNGETDTHYRLKSDVPGFSTYAITLTSEEDKGGLPLVPVLIVLLISAVAGAAYMKRDEIEELMTGEEEVDEEEGYSYEE